MVDYIHSFKRHKMKGEFYDNRRDCRRAGEKGKELWHVDAKDRGGGADGV